MSDSSTPSAARYLPHVIVATLLVAVAPVAAVWVLRSRGVVSSTWVGVGLAVVLSCRARPRLPAVRIGSAGVARTT